MKSGILTKENNYYLPWDAIHILNKGKNAIKLLEMLYVYLFIPIA
jgi:hypothetical protein